MPERRVIELAEREGLGLGGQQFTCANPRCDEQFIRTSARGRPKDFHSEDCRRAALRDLRRIMAQLAHHERARVARRRAGAMVECRDERDLAGARLGHRMEERHRIAATGDGEHPAPRRDSLDGGRQRRKRRSSVGLVRRGGQRFSL